jgi:hypothetical protein
VEQRVCSAEKLRSPAGADGADVADVVVIDVRRDRFVEVLLIVHDAGDHER